MSSKRGKGGHVLYSYQHPLGFFFMLIKFSACLGSSFSEGNKLEDSKRNLDPRPGRGDQR